MLIGENKLSVAVIQRIQHLRELKGYSVDELARRVSEAGVTITRQGIAQQERGRTRSVTVDYMFAAATALGVSPASLLGLEPCERCGGSPPPGFICAVCGIGEWL